MKKAIFMTLAIILLNLSMKSKGDSLGGIYASCDITVRGYHERFYIFMNEQDSTFIFLMFTPEDLSCIGIGRWHDMKDRIRFFNYCGEPSYIYELMSDRYNGVAFDLPIIGGKISYSGKPLEKQSSLKLPSSISKFTHRIILENAVVTEKDGKPYYRNSYFNLPDSSTVMPPMTYIKL